MMARKCAAASSKEKASTTGFIPDLDCCLFGAGTHYEIYQRLGTHPKTYKGEEGIYFAVWTLHTKEAHLVGDFNNWNLGADPMERISESGIWEIFSLGIKLGELYKFIITTQFDRVLYRTNPFTFSAEYHPGTIFVTADVQNFSWTGSTWIKKRARADVQKLPISIYEIHLGFWCKQDRPEENGFYTYTETAHELAAYVKEMGYTRVELMDIAKHPFDGSWGYQVVGYFVSTSCYGTPAKLMYFINYLHKNGIGVTLDWVPAHFPKDAYGLADLDSGPSFEYADPRKGGRPDWGAKVSDYGKDEVKDFLANNALYWMGQYHVNGLRADIVASILYLDYERQEGQWVPNIHDGNQDLEAIELFKYLSTAVQRYNRGVLVTARGPTAWPKVMEHSGQGGLDFTFGWNIGWMRDLPEYMKLDPCSRKYNHHHMTFGLAYFTSEGYILVLPHNEMAHLKYSMINKMLDLGKDKLSNLRAGYTFMMGHPGKRFLFMGQDFGQFHGWGKEASLNWYLTDEDDYGGLQSYVKDLLHLCKRYPLLYRQDNDWSDFQWTNTSDDGRSIFSLTRRGGAGKKNLTFTISFTLMGGPDYRVGASKCGRYTLLLDNHDVYKTTKVPCFSSSKNECDGQPHSLSCPLPTYRTAAFHL